MIWNPKIIQRLGILLSLFVTCAALAQSKEYQVKAAFLYNFAQFVEWPPEAFETNDTPFTIGILGDDPFGGALDETVKDEAIGDHKFVVQRTHHVADLKNCQLIFISRSEKDHLKEIFSALGTRPVLTVSEIEGFDRRGGIINFYPEGTKVRFEINPASAQKGGLKISSQLLSLGKIIQTGKESK